MFRKVVCRDKEALWSKTTCRKRQTSCGREMTAWDLD
jgi:hypothetical protein